MGEGVGGLVGGRFVPMITTIASHLTLTTLSLNTISNTSSSVPRWGGGM